MRSKPVPDATPGRAYFSDPLEQFDVLAILPSLHFTNLALLLALNLVVMASFLAAFRVAGRTTYDFVVRSLYQLVRSIAKENIYIRKQQYFSIIFFLFATLLLANLVGMLPYSFTITSSFVVTFFIALMHFLGINLIGATQHR